jgi:hypothetical protein
MDQIRNGDSLVAVDDVKAESISCLSGVAGKSSFRQRCTKQPGRMLPGSGEGGGKYADEMAGEIKFSIELEFPLPCPLRLHSDNLVAGRLRRRREKVGG